VNSKASAVKLNVYVQTPVFKDVDYIRFGNKCGKDNDGLVQLSWEGLSGGWAEFTNNSSY